MTDADTVDAVPKAKIAITIDEDVLAQIKRAVEHGRAPSVSAYIEHGVQYFIENKDSFRLMLEEMLDETGGPLTDDEKARIDRELGWA